MIVRVTIHPDQIRYYAQSALNGFEDLSQEDAIENARQDLQAILAYLDSFGGGVELTWPTDQANALSARFKRASGGGIGG